MTSMKKKSMITSGIILLGLANLAWDFIDYTRGAREYRQQEIYRSAVLVAQLIEDVKEAKTPVERQDLLKSLQEREKIGFFIIKNDREPASSSLPDVVDPNFNSISDGKVRLIEDEKSEVPLATYVGEKIGTQDIVIGKLIPRDYIYASMAFNRANFWRNFLFQLLILVLVMSYSFRELGSLMKRLQWGGMTPAGGAGLVKASGAFGSQEAQAINAVFEKVSEQNLQHSNELERIRNQILPSLQHELALTQDLPYEFDSIMVRVDINQSTAVYSNPELREIQQYWFDYFKVNCAEIATRYHGFVHEELGDEVIIYFKIAQKENGLRTAGLSAMACVRDIFGLSEEIDHEIQKRFKFPFRVKAALDQGRLRVFRSSFASSDLTSSERRLKIEGAGGTSRNPFLTTVRMLKFVEDKSVNSCVASAPVYEAGKDLVKKTLPMLNSIADFEDEISYLWITSFSVDNEKENRALDPYFLSNDIFHGFLEKVMALPIEQFSDQALQSQLLAFRQLKLGRVSAEIREVYIKSLVKLEAQAKTPDAIRVLSTLLAMAPQIVNYAKPPDELDKVIRCCMLHENDRVQANAIEVWGALQMQLNDIKEHMKAFRHNRSLANFLVASLKNGLDKAHLKLLSKMLENKNEFMRAAGAYAFGEIAEHYKKYNPGLLSANPLLIEQIELLNKLKKDSSAMVRRQAENALSKV